MQNIVKSLIVVALDDPEVGHNGARVYKGYTNWLVTVGMTVGKVVLDKRV